MRARVRDPIVDPTVHVVGVWLYRVMNEFGFSYAAPPTIEDHVFFLYHTLDPDFGAAHDLSLHLSERELDRHRGFDDETLSNEDPLDHDQYFEALEESNVRTDRARAALRTRLQQLSTVGKSPGQIADELFACRFTDDDIYIGLRDEWTVSDDDDESVYGDPPNSISL